MAYPNSPRLKKARQVKSKVKSMLIIFAISRGCSQKICPGRSNSQSCTPPWRCAVTAWKCVNTLHSTLATKELAVASQQNTISQFLFHQGIFWPKTTWLLSPTHPTRLAWLPATFLFLPIEEAAILSQLRWSRQNILTEHTTSRMHLKDGRNAGNSEYARKGTTFRPEDLKLTTRNLLLCEVGNGLVGLLIARMSVAWEKFVWKASTLIKLNSVVWVRERNMQTERPPFVGEVIANFCR
jgi:hypothetical protein